MPTVCPYRILSSSTSMICGTLVILYSVFVLKSDHLQIDKYISNIFRERDSSRFQVEVLGSCFITIVIGIAQSVGSLMYLVHEIKLNGWIWVNFTCIVGYAVCIFMLDQPKLLLQSFTEYYVSLVSNTFISTVILFMGIVFKTYSFVTTK